MSPSETGENPLESMLDEDNFEYKHDAFHDNTEVDYSSGNECLSQLNYSPN
jgi:hypothetical protein